MIAEEIDVALDELENRLDRLRSLYEQYFLGIEKIEPAVARKDVDRRFWLLRRTKIRNTARRFRLQVLIQRYNTFQQYWVRICREIENGTYTRHLLRAQKQLGTEPKTWAAKKRLGYFRKRGEGDNGHPSQPPNSDEALARMLDSGTDLDAEAARAAAEALVSAEARSREQPRPDGPIPASPVAASAPGQIASTPPPRPLRRGALEMLDLDLDDDLGPSLAPARPKTQGSGLKAADPAQAQSSAPAAAPIPARPPAPISPAPIPARPPAPIPPARPPAPIPVPPPSPSPLSPSPLSPSPSPLSPSPSPLSPSPSPSLARPLAPTTQATPPTRVPLPKPPQRSVTEKPAASQATAHAAHGLSDQRLKQIHAELSAAKRQAKQADAVSLDALTKSLRDSEQRLRAQHPGRNVDFHVVVKDGKPVVKPIIRK